MSDVLGTVLDAVAVVADVDRAALTERTTFAEIGADSLVLVAVADLIEQQLGAGGALRQGAGGALGSGARGWRIADDRLGAAVTLGDLADYVGSLAAGR